VRYCDLAATEKTERNDPDWTVGIKLGRDKSGGYYLLDMVRVRANPGDVERLLRKTAEQDGNRVHIGFGQDPGQAGKSQALHLGTMTKSRGQCWSRPARHSSRHPALRRPSSMSVLLRGSPGDALSHIHFECGGRDRDCLPQRLLRLFNPSELAQRPAKSSVRQAPARTRVRGGSQAADRLCAAGHHKY
jgi:hypothetical protein